MWKSKNQKLIFE